MNRKILSQIDVMEKLASYTKVASIEYFPTKEIVDNLAVVKGQLANLKADESYKQIIDQMVHTISSFKSPAPIENFSKDSLYNEGKNIISIINGISKYLENSTLPNTESVTSAVDKTIISVNNALVSAGSGRVNPDIATPVVQKQQLIAVDPHRKEKSLFQQELAKLRKTKNVSEQLDKQTDEYIAELENKGLDIEEEYNKQEFMAALEALKNQS
jgi:hypothetical protein